MSVSPTRHTCALRALPAGNAAAGWQAVRELTCDLCHQVAGEARFPAPVAPARGPDLGETVRRQPASDVAAADLLTHLQSPDGRP